MGNQNSKPPGAPASPTSTDKKVDRRKSIQAIGSGKATAADPSASRASATAQNLIQPSTQPIQEQLQRAHSPELVPPKHYEKLTRFSSRDSTAPDAKIQEHRAKEKMQETSVPMDVPVTAEKTISHESGQHHPESSAPNFLADYAKLQRPPRLPLPIAEADHAPGSPLLAPIAGDDKDVSVFDDDVIGLPRKTSMLSSTTVDEDELGDELSPFVVDTNVSTKVVPTVVEWKQRGERVYVTGTFANWDKKFKLHKNKDGGLSCVLQLPPGTHHLKFIVDGEMKASDNLPTAVDYMNVLVNYIEVNADDISLTQQDGARPIPGSQSPKMTREEHRPEPIEEEEEEEQDHGQPELIEEEILDSDYRQLMPQALIDIEKPDETDEYKDAYKIISETSGPPSLPLFLGRSILNGVLPMKDDSSVLTLPNHTVLNHLATSSIKNGVLATSVTTRYKKKYVTTIMYKPTILESPQKPAQQGRQQHLPQQAKEA